MKRKKRRWSALWWYRMSREERDFLFIITTLARILHHFEYKEGSEGENGVNMSFEKCLGEEEGVRPNKLAFAASLNINFSSHPHISSLSLSLHLLVPIVIISRSNMSSLPSFLFQHFSSFRITLSPSFSLHPSLNFNPAFHYFILSSLFLPSPFITGSNKLDETWKSSRFPFPVNPEGTRCLFSVHLTRFETRRKGRERRKRKRKWKRWWKETVSVTTSLHFVERGRKLFHVNDFILFSIHISPQTFSTELFLLHQVRKGENH